MSPSLRFHSVVEIIQELTRCQCRQNVTVWRMETHDVSDRIQNPPAFVDESSLRF